MGGTQNTSETSDASDDQERTKDGRLRSSEVSASVEFQVPFHDCDPMQIVWHGNYARYFERARTALFQTMQLDVPDIQELGYLMFVSETRCRYLYPLRYNDTVTVRARCTRIGAVLRISYTAFNGTQQRKSARGYTELAFTDPDGSLITELPEAIYERIVRV